MPEKTCLGEITPQEFEAHKDVIKDEIVKNRVTHVIYEDDRVLKSVQALKAGDIKTFGQYLNQSHASLKDLYEERIPLYEKYANIIVEMPDGTKMDAVNAVLKVLNA